MSALGRPLLEIEVPNRPPIAMIESCLESPRTRRLNQLNLQPWSWMSYDPLAVALSPFEKFSARMVICSH